MQIQARLKSKPEQKYQYPILNVLTTWQFRFEKSHSQDVMCVAAKNVYIHRKISETLSARRLFGIVSDSLPNLTHKLIVLFLNVTKEREKKPVCAEVNRQNVTKQKGFRKPYYGYRPFFWGALPVYHM